MSVRVNNQEYAWGDIEVRMWGQMVVNLKDITYTSSKDKTLNFGAGRNALGIQHGKRSNGGTLTVGQSELDAMNAAAREKGYKDLLDVEMDILVTYIREFETEITVDKITCASFKALPKGMAQENDSSKHKLEFVCLDIEYDV